VRSPDETWDGGVHVRSGGVPQVMVLRGGRGKRTKQCRSPTDGRIACQDGSIQAGSCSSAADISNRRVLVGQ